MKDDSLTPERARWSMQWQVRGIPIRIHWSFVLWVAWLTLTSGGPPLGELVFVLSIFGCVLLHELGHALTARRFGVETRQITLYPFGGIATLDAMPKPWAELWIALAGPAVNVVIAALLYPFTIDAAEAARAGAPLTTWLFWANVGLVLFNLLPALPMDGGRVLRSALALLHVRRATIIAARVSQALSIGLAILALFAGLPMLLIIAGLVFLGAMQEQAQGRALSAAQGLTVRDVMTPREDLLSFLHGTTLSAALGHALRSYQPLFPVVHNGSVLGVVDRQTLIQTAAGAEEEQYLSSVMRRSFPRISPNESLAELMMSPATRDERGYLVFDGDEFLGMVVRDQLLEHLLVRDAAQSESAVVPSGHNRMA